MPGRRSGGVDVRGSAPGTRETDLLRGYNLVERVNAIMLSGGSAFGLDAASGAMAYLEEQGWGMDVGPTVVPIVPGAVIFDLGVGDPKVRPGRAEGYAACQAASDAPVAQGLVGAGTGATIAKAFGQEYARPGGVGSCCLSLAGGVLVAALVVVNALGGRLRPGNREPIGRGRARWTAYPLLDQPCPGSSWVWQYHHRGGGHQCQAHPGGGQ